MSKDDITRIVAVARDEAPLIHLESYAAVAAVITSLAAEVERMRAERAEVLALLEATDDYQSTDYCDEDAFVLDEECADVYDDNTAPCWSHRAAVLIAKLRGAP